MRLTKWCINASLAAAFTFAPFVTLQAEDVSPLDRLRERSANKRWEEVRGTWTPVQAESMDVHGSRLVNNSGEFVAPQRPGIDWEAGRKPLAASAPERTTGAKTESSITEVPNSQARPFPPMEAASPFPKPAIVHSVPDPYTPKTPIAPDALTQPQSIHRPLVEAEQLPPMQIPLAEQTGTAVLNSTGVEAIILAESLPAMQVSESPLLIAPPVMTAQADPKPEPDVPPALDVEVPENAENDGDQKPLSLVEQTDKVFRPISEIEPYFDYSPSGENPTRYLCPQPSSIPESERERCPEVKSLPEQGSLDRNFVGTDFFWQASNLTHNPLYFEDVSLERYGHTYPDIVQPFVSVGKFGVQLIGLPYQMALEGPHSCRYPLGYYRPGECAPHLKYRIPFNAKAAVTAGAFYTGAVLLFP